MSSGEAKVSAPALLACALLLLASLAPCIAAAPDAAPGEARRLSDRVNSPADDYLPHFSVDGRQLVFTSNRPGGMDAAGRAGVHREDLWTSRGAPDGGWGQAQLLAGVNTPDSEGAASLSADGRLLVFAACDRPGGRGDCDLFLREFTGGAWAPPRPLDEASGPFWDSHPALAADGCWLVFASSRPGGLGGRDLWISRRDSLGRFGPAVNPGAPLNSPADEAGPFLHADGRSLYFSSDRPGGLGGMDLLFSRRGDDGRWSVPVNLGPPLSTPAPDLGLCLAGDGRLAVFASRREGRPDLDLYETAIPECCPAGSVRLVAGRVRQAGTRLPLPARLRAEALGDALATAVEATAHGDGVFALVLPPGEHLLLADHPGHLFASRLVRVADPDSAGRAWASGATDADTLLLELEPLAAGAATVLEALRFDFDRAELRPEALPLLRQVLALLEANPRLTLELRGHTDDRGDPAHNEALSLARARAVKDWLVAAGIQEIRIATSGAGAREPRQAGRDEASRAANRRTELRLREY